MTQPQDEPRGEADAARRRGRAGGSRRRREHSAAPSAGDAGKRGPARAEPVAPGSVSPTVEQAAELLRLGPQSLLAQVEEARASGLSRAFDGRWKCPTGEVVMILGNHVADRVGRLDWSLRAYRPGVATRRARATIDWFAPKAPQCHRTTTITTITGIALPRLPFTNGGAEGKRVRYVEFC